MIVGVNMPNPVSWSVWSAYLSKRADPAGPAIEDVTRVSANTGGSAFTSDRTRRVSKAAKIWIIKVRYESHMAPSQICFAGLSTVRTRQHKVGSIAHATSTVYRTALNSMEYLGIFSGAQVESTNISRALRLPSWILARFSPRLAQ